MASIYFELGPKRVPFYFLFRLLWNKGGIYMAVKIFEFEMDRELLEKLKFIANEQDISINEQIIILIQKAINEFEEKQGFK